MNVLYNLLSNNGVVHEFVKTDLYPLSLKSLRYAVCLTGCGSIIGRCIGACNGTSCAEERRPQCQ